MKNIWTGIAFLTILVIAMTGCATAENTQVSGSQAGSGNSISKTDQSTQEPQKDSSQMT